MGFKPQTVDSYLISIDQPQGIALQDGEHIVADVAVDGKVQRISSWPSQPVEIIFPAGEVIPACGPASGTLRCTFYIVVDDEVSIGAVRHKCSGAPRECGAVMASCEDLAEFGQTDSAFQLWLGLLELEEVPLGDSVAECSVAFQAAFMLAKAAVRPRVCLTVAVRSSDAHAAQGLAESSAAALDARAVAVARSLQLQLQLQRCCSSPGMQLHVHSGEIIRELSAAQAFLRQDTVARTRVHEGVEQALLLKIQMTQSRFWRRGEQAAAVVARLRLSLQNYALLLNVFCSWSDDKNANHAEKAEENYKMQVAVAFCTARATHSLLSIAFCCWEQAVALQSSPSQQCSPVGKFNLLAADHRLRVASVVARLSSDFASSLQRNCLHAWRCHVEKRVVDLLQNCLAEKDALWKRTAQNFNRKVVTWLAGDDTVLSRLCVQAWMQLLVSSRREASRQRSLKFYNKTFLALLSDDCAFLLQMLWSAWGRVVARRKSEARRRRSRQIVDRAMCAWLFEDTVSLLRRLMSAWFWRAAHNRLELVERWRQRSIRVLHRVALDRLAEDATSILRKVLKEWRATALLRLRVTRSVKVVMGRLAEARTEQLLAKSTAAWRDHAQKLRSITHSAPCSPLPDGSASKKAEDSFETMLESMTTASTGSSPDGPADAAQLDERREKILRLVSTSSVRRLNSGVYEDEASNSRKVLTAFTKLKIPSAKAIDGPAEAPQSEKSLHSSRRTGIASLRAAANAQ